MEWIIIIVVAVVLFGGASQLPKLARSLGTFTTEFNSAREEAEEALELKKNRRNKKTKDKE